VTHKIAGRSLSQLEANDFEFPLIIMGKPAEPSLASNMLLSVQKSDACVSSETVPLVHKLVL